MRLIRGNELAMIFQDDFINPVFTCGDQVMEAIMLHKTSASQMRKS